MNLTNVCGCDDQVFFENKCQNCQDFFNEEVPDWNQIYDVLNVSFILY